MAIHAPAAAAKLVLTKIRAMDLSAVVVEPGLNPNQPSHRMNTPRAASGMLWPGIGLHFAVLAVFADARAQYHGAGQGHPAADGVDDGRAGEVDEAQFFQPAAALIQAAPGPAAENGVDERADKDAVHQITDESWCVRPWRRKRWWRPWRRRPPGTSRRPVPRDRRRA